MKRKLKSHSKITESNTKRRRVGNWNQGESISQIKGNKLDQASRRERAEVTRITRAGQRIEKGQNNKASSGEGAVEGDEWVIPIEKRIEGFIQRIVKQRKKSDIERVCKEERERLKKIYPNANTRHRYFTKYRNCIKDYLTKQSLLVQGQRKQRIRSKDIIDINHLETIEKIIFSKMKLQKNERDQRQHQIDVSLDKKTNQVGLFDLELFLASCREFIKNKHDPYTVAIGIMGLTGRRSIEVLKTGLFTVISPYQMGFSGQVKTKNSPNARHSYTIPVLEQAPIILEALGRVRSVLKLDSLSNEQIDRIHGRKLLYRAKRFRHCIFPNSQVPLNCRSLRSIYVASAYKLFKMSTKVSFNAYAARVLGHSQLDKDTANSYTYFAIRPKGQEKKQYSRPS